MSQAEEYLPEDSLEIAPSEEWKYLEKEIFYPDLILNFNRNIILS